MRKRSVPLAEVLNARASTVHALLTSYLWYNGERGEEGTGTQVNFIRSYFVFIRQGTQVKEVKYV